MIFVPILFMFGIAGIGLSYSPVSSKPAPIFVDGTETPYQQTPSICVPSVRYAKGESHANYDKLTEQCPKTRE